MFIVGSNVDVTAVKAHMKDVVSVPVIAPEEPEVALARGAALASANAPRYDASTVGLAYSQDPDETTTYALADDATTFLGDANSLLDTADIASDSDGVSERSKPFLLMGSSLTAIFVAGVTALAVAMVISIQPTADQHSGEMTVDPEAVAPPTASQPARPAAPQQVPETVPAPAPAAPPAPIATARLKVLPAAPPPVVVRNVAPVPAAPPPAPAAPPPVVVAPAIQPPIIQWLPPILLPPPFFNPGPKGPGGRGGGGHGGGGHGHGGD